MFAGRQTRITPIRPKARPTSTTEQWDASLGVKERDKGNERGQEIKRSISMNGAESD